MFKAVWCYWESISFLRTIGLVLHCVRGALVPDNRFVVVGWIPGFFSLAVSVFEAHCLYLENCLTRRASTFQEIYPNLSWLVINNSVSFVHSQVGLQAVSVCCGTSNSPPWYSRMSEFRWGLPRNAGSSSWFLFPVNATDSKDASLWPWQHLINTALVSYGMIAQR